MASAFGYDLGDLESLSLAGIESSWVSADEKRSMRRAFVNEFAALRREYGLPAYGKD